ncbi:hypothetical protein [Polymorphospora sp. NPDC050346]|uniref:hypothetical protein n=1 Tax=Polymorphospora sp. NPDC050346 TaxID=3155780 RepID=UPI0034035862
MITLDPKIVDYVDQACDAHQRGDHDAIRTILARMHDDGLGPAAHAIIAGLNEMSILTILAAEAAGAQLAVSLVTLTSDSAPFNLDTDEPPF